MLPRENHLSGCTRSKPSQGSVPAGLALASDFSFCFQCKVGSSLVLRRPIETTAVIVQVDFIFRYATVEAPGAISRSQMAEEQSGAVTAALEAYLSDFFQTGIDKHSELRRRFVETNPEFSKQKFSLSNVFEEHESIDVKVGEYLVSVLWHNLAVVKNMFADTLEIKFPDELAGLFKAVLTRHDLVHRNGRKKEGGEHCITLDQVDELLKMAEMLVDDIEGQWEQLDPAKQF